MASSQFYHGSVERTEPFLTVGGTDAVSLLWIPGSLDMEMRDSAPEGG